MRQKKKWLGVLCFVLLFVLLFASLQWILQDKGAADADMYARVRQFYREETVPEVVFVGTSHVHCGVNPLVMFQEYGFTGYDFSTPLQELLVSELYVAEALRRDGVRVICLDAREICSYGDPEPYYRKALDPLPLSAEKLRTVRAAKERAARFGFDEDYGSELSYVFPLLRFHDRWKELGPADFGEPENSAGQYGTAHFHGYVPHYQTARADFGSYQADTALRADVMAEQKEILTRIRDACAAADVALVLFKTPSPEWREDYHDLVRGWAEELGLPFLDCNERMEEAGIRPDTDFLDSDSHLNDAGAAKLSRYLGRWLQEQYDLPDHRGEAAYAAWQEDWEVYRQDQAAYRLSGESDWGAYLARLDDPHYRVFVAVRDTIGGDRAPELAAQLQNLGLSENLAGKGAYSYLALIDRGEVLWERLADAPLVYETRLDGQRVRLVSESYAHGNRASILLDRRECFVDQRGVGIVVYDTLLETVADSVTFDLWDGGKAFR